MGFQGVFGEKGEDQEMLTFHFLAVEALLIGHVLNSKMDQDSALPCLPHAEAFILLCSIPWGSLMGVWCIHATLLRVNWKRLYFLTISQTIVAVALWGKSSKTKRLESQSIGVHPRFLMQESLLWHPSRCLDTENQEEVSPSPTLNSFVLSETFPAASAEQEPVVQHEWDVRAAAYLRW